MALGRKQFLVSHLGWLLEAKCEFSPRQMTDFNDRTRLIDCLAYVCSHLLTIKNLEKYKCSCFDSAMIQICTKKSI